VRYDVQSQPKNLDCCDQHVFDAVLDAI
jgi:hypothetical protein